MSKSLASVLAGIDDRKAIEKLLMVTRNNSEHPEQRSENADPETLQEHYERFLSRRENRSPGTRAQYRRTIPTFIRFAEENGINTATAITTTLVDNYVDELQELHRTDATIMTYTKNVRSWLRWLNKRGQCTNSVYQVLDKDALGLTPKARDEALPPSEATTILRKLRSQRRGSIMHALLELLWNSGIRIGGAHALDIRDFDAAKNEVRLRHRPESGTRLKNGSEDVDTAGDGERNVALTEEVVDGINCYLASDRPNTPDGYGRKPLFATEHGRATRSTLRRKIYEATSCRWASGENDSRMCDGNCDPDSTVCQYSYCPHAIRRGAIVNHLSGGLHPSIASERFDVSIPTLRKHYDPRTKLKRKEDRLEAVKSSWTD